MIREYSYFVFFNKKAHFRERREGQMAGSKVIRTSQSTSNSKRSPNPRVYGVLSRRMVGPKNSVWLHSRTCLMLSTQ